ncbi:hypothetical protein GGR92_004902 [Spirosoma lacussanchae]|uniref:DUF6660 family protein n=1 Tax=Spirosoma lacussanchae TaxID=1884249 RepID=UPI0011080912|nr:DUF6660 family protein [Spirosoma lacussanchae]
MKWLTTLLAFYLLALSLWPCTDEPLPTTGQAGRVMVASATPTESEQAHHHEQDACSPFCICACCAATLTVAPRFQYSLSPSVENAPAAVAGFSYASEHPLDPITAIWQPPQLQV